MTTAIAEAPALGGARETQAERGNRTCDLVALLPRGESIRNFVFSGMLDTLAARRRVRVFSVVPNAHFREDLAARYGPVQDLAPPQEPRAVRIVRELLDLAHGRWLGSEAARERWRLRDLEAAGGSKWLKRRLKTTACRPFANRAGLELLSTIEASLGRRSAAGTDYTRLLGDLRPRLVFNSSHVHGGAAIPAVRAAQRLGIPTAAFIFSWHNLTSQGRIMPQYDYYLVWNDAIRDQILGMYRRVTPDRVFVTGTPQFDFHFRPDYWWSRETFCRAVGADPTRPIVLYCTGMANHMPGEPAIVERIADILAGLGEFGPPQLLVRVYPKDLTGRFEKMKQRRPDILIPDIPWEAAWLTPKLEDAYLLTNMLRHAAAGCNVASTVSLELCMFDKPVINIGYNPPGRRTDPVDFARYYRFEHYRPVVESGAVEVAGDEAELRRMLVVALAHPAARSRERRLLISRFFGPSLDGGASGRVAGALEEIMERHGR